MAIEMNKEEGERSIASIKRYFHEELEVEVSDMKARFILGYFLKEIAPFAYNKGVKDAENFFREKIEDLSGTCFEPEETYWNKKPKR